MTAEIRDTISTTQLARSLPAAIDRVRIQRRPLAITKGKRTVARLEPPPQDGFPITELGRMLANLPRLGKDAARLLDDLARVRSHARTPENPWAS